MSDWIGLPDEEELSKWFGFVYKITNVITNKFYIGKKQLTRNVKLKPLKGKTKSRRVEKQSDWRDYYGSSNELLKDIEKYGKPNFRREILHMTTCKWESAYLELWEQITQNVILRDDSYNSILNLRIGKVPKSLKEKYQQSEIVGK
jgi:Putative endonuclease segE, GIY-YIG domain